ncbi:MAG TPA: hypothetical protein VHB30_08825, partial [Solirubrobacteraceae bacterium]|nr:hypothetical protein [Solirubrobacteraceae bacterium]
QTQLRQLQLADAQHRLVAARNHLTRLVNRMRLATRALARNLVSSYEDDKPDITTVVLKARGFSELLDTVDYLKRVGSQDAHVLDGARRARREVVGQTVTLQRLETRYRSITAQLMRSRADAAAVQGALLGRQVRQVASRAETQAKLDHVKGKIASIRSEIERLQRAALQAPGPTGATGPDSAAQHLPVAAEGMAQPSAGAPAQVAQAIAAGNVIAGLPYQYGGGHASFRAAAYDCSGSVSYALAAAGLVSSPLNSTGFESWGEPGPGQWITVYANAGHAYMVIDGWRFDTSALSAGGTRFTRAMRSNAGFVARHPPGL